MHLTNNVCLTARCTYVLNVTEMDMICPPGESRGIHIDGIEQMQTADRTAVHVPITHVVCVILNPKPQCLLASCTNTDGDSMHMYL